MASGFPNRSYLHLFSPVIPRRSGVFFFTACGTIGRREEMKVLTSCLIAIDVVETEGNIVFLLMVVLKKKLPCDRVLMIRTTVTAKCFTDIKVQQ